MTSHVVGDQGDRNIFLCQFPGGQPRSLQERPCFICEDTHFLPRLNSRSNYPECCPKTRGGQGACVAMRQHCGGIGQEVSTELTHPFIAGNVLLLNCERLFDQSAANQICRSSFAL